MKTVVLGALLLALALVGLPAQAESTYGSTTGVNGVLYDDCRYHPYLYDVTVPPDAGYWALTTTLVAPNGSVTAGDYVATPTSGTSRFGLLCPPGDTYGTYTIRASVAWGPDENTLGDPVQLADSYFSMRKPRTRTSLSISDRRPSYGQRVRYRIRVWDERPAGYFPTAFAWVHLEKKVDGRWVRIKGTRTLTHDTGRVSLRLRYRYHHKRLRIRSVAETSPTFSRSVSPLVRLW